jgi:stage II sporulation protein Q
MIKKRLKEWVMPVLTVFILTGLLLIYYLVNNYPNSSLIPEDSYFTNVLITPKETIEVNNEIQTSIIKPYIGEEVIISKSYYDKNETEENQQKSLIKYENIYMPNTGILYSSDTEFNVVSVLDGKIISIKEDNILGNIIEIEHNNNLVTIYQSVKNVSVKIGDIIKQGDIIALSGPNKLENEKENSLHFEVYQNGSLVNPQDLLDNNVSES